LQTLSGCMTARVRCSISFDQLDRICEALDCTLPELLEYIPNPQPKTGENLILEEHGNRKKKSS
jgi:putative transcriptional regulator